MFAENVSSEKLILGVFCRKPLTSTFVCGNLQAEIRQTSASTLGSSFYFFCKGL
jgi:hypothetical protein